MSWTVKHVAKPEVLKNPVLIEGLPGIGNVGKIVTDFLIDQLKAKKVAEFNGLAIPHSVFVNEKNLVELPRIELFLAKTKQRDLLLLAGDVQPLTEESCYEFCEAVLKYCKELHCTELIALGGIGLKQIPKKPKTYCTGTNKQVVSKFSKLTGVSNKLYGVVGPIVGVSGVLVGLAEQHKIEAVALLAETYGHPMYLGLKGARELLAIIGFYAKLKMNLKLLDEDMAELEDEMLTREVLPKYRKFPGKGETSYIG